MAKVLLEHTKFLNKINILAKLKRILYKHTSKYVMNNANFMLKNVLNKALQINFPDGNALYTNEQFCLKALFLDPLTCRKT